MLKITTESTQIAKQEPTDVKMVEVPMPVQPVRKIRADLYLQQLTTQQTNLQAQLDKITAQISELTDAGVELPKPVQAIKPVA